MKLLGMALLGCGVAGTLASAAEKARIYDARIELSVSIVSEERGGKLRTFQGIESRFLNVDELDAPTYEKARDVWSFNGTLLLPADRELRYRLAYARKAGTPIHVKLERTLVEGSGQTRLPHFEGDIDVMGCRTLALLDDDGEGRKLHLRIVPLVLPDLSDEPIETSTFEMWVEDAALMELMPPGKEDRVIFSSVNIRRAGLEFGIPGTGVLRLSPRSFEGAAPCGWVRGHVLSCKLGDHEYKLWSASLMLPEDPSRPLLGWTLYGSLGPFPKGKEEIPYYGWKR